MRHANAASDAVSPFISLTAGSRDLVTALAPLQSPCVRDELAHLARTPPHKNVAVPAAYSMHVDLRQVIPSHLDAHVVLRRDKELNACTAAQRLRGLLTPVGEECKQLSRHRHLVASLIECNGRRSRAARC